MCKRDELKGIIEIAGEPDCDPNAALRLLKNAKRGIAESGSELNDADKAELAAASNAAKQAALTRYQELLAAI